jgi:hypothetical protein
MNRTKTLKSITQSLSNKAAEFVILPPIGAFIPRVFQTVENSDRLHGELLSSTQRFRGAIYLQDGAVREQQLTADGRHALPVDEESWHVVTLDEAGKICACLRVHQQLGVQSFDDLPVSRASISQCPSWGSKIRQAVESEIHGAHTAGLRFGDVGGWAIAPERRRTLEPLRTILAGYSVMQLLGGVVGIATATCKHGSAQILRKLGLRPLEADGETIPGYYDHHYDSEMEVLRFDSRHPNPRYRTWIAELCDLLSQAPVVCAGVRRHGPQNAMARQWHPAPFSAPQPAGGRLTL